jgi:hypothetical protein
MLSSKTTAYLGIYRLWPKLTCKHRTPQLSNDRGATCEPKSIPNSDWTCYMQLADSIYVVINLIAFCYKFYLAKARYYVVLYEILFDYISTGYEWYGSVILL